MFVSAARVSGQAIQFVGASANTVNTNTTLSLTKPGSTAVGDLILIQVGYTVNTGSINALSGFDALFPSNTSQGDLEYQLFWRIADGTEGANFSITSGANRNWVGSIAVYRNVDPVSPFESVQVSVGNMGNNANSFDAPSVTPVNSSGWLVNMLLGRHNSTPTSITGTAGMNTRASSASVANRMILVQDEALSSASATGTRTVTFTPNSGGGGGAGSTRAFSTVSLVLRQAEAVPPLSETITFVGSAANTGGSNTTATVPKPAGVEIGDFILIQVGYPANGGTINTPAGYNSLYNTVQGNLRGALFYKFADGSEPANLTVTFSANQNWIISTAVYRNVNPYSEFEADATTQANMDNVRTFSAPSATAVNNEGVLVSLMLGRHNTTPVYVVGGAMNQRASVTALNRMILINDEQLTATGATGTRASEFFPAQGTTGNNTAFFATNIILRPHIKMYSYQSGDWGVLNSWTRDPSGTTLVKSRIPVQFDEVTMLNGRTITRSTNGINVSKTTIQAGGFLNIGATTGHSLGNVSGGGRLQLSTVTFPSGTFTDFVSAIGGTVEFFNSGGTLPTGVGTYNNVILRNSTGSNITYTQASNIVMNGSLTLTRTSTGTLTLQHGDNTTARSLTIGNGATVGAGTSWTVFNGNQQGHTVSINGNLINNGTIRFTNQATPNYTAATTTGAVLLTMTGGQSNDLTANGVTDLYRLIMDKGIDRTPVLSVTASNTSNFRLFGPNNAAESGSPPTITDNRALSLLTGTIRLGTNIVIPSLVSGGGNNYRIDEDVMLWLDGANVTVADAPTFNSPASLIPHGALRVSGSSVLTDNSTQGIVTREKAVLLFEGGTTTTVCIRTSFSAGTQRGAFTMTGGTVTIDGTLPTGFGSSMALYAPLFLPYPDNTFEMSGGTLNILNSSPLTGQSGENFSMVVGALPDNINITGGTINITVPATRPAYINTSSPFWNLNVISSASTHSLQPRLYLRTDDASYGVNAQPTVPFTLNAQDIVVRNNLSLQNSAVMTSGVAVKDVIVGGNFTIGSSATYTPSTNTTFFNGSGTQLFTLDGTITSGLNNLTIAKPADSLKLAGSAGTLLVLNQFNLNGGVFADQGKTVEIRGNMNLSGTHTGSGKLALTTATSRTITGNGNGVVGNIDLDGPASAVTATLSAALRINGTLTFVPNGANNRLLDIGANNLTFGPNGTTANASGPTAPIRMVKTNGLQSAGGVSKIFSGLSFTFPVGAGAANRYTPATVSFDVAPTVYGTITIRPVTNEHPNVTAFGRSLTQYWRTTSSGFTLGPAKVSQTYTYVDASVVTGAGITEDGYVAARYTPSTATWTTGTASDVDETTNVATFGGATFDTVIDGEYTAGDNFPVDPFGTVAIYYSYTTGGAWNNVNTWSLDGHTGIQNIPGTIPGSNSVVRVGNGHTVNVTANGANAGSLVIETGSVLDLGITTGHNFGSFVGEQITGSGTLRISSSVATAVFPAGDFSEFIGPTGGTVEYYRTTTNFTIPTTSAAPTSLSLTNYRNLVVNVAAGAAATSITFPAQNLTIYEDLTVKGLSGTNVILANTATGNLSIARDLLIESSALRMQYNTANARTVTVGRNVQIDSGATFGTLNSTTDVTHDLTVNGSVTNNGTYNLFLTTARHTRLTFLGAANASFTGSNGSASTTIFELTVNKGTSSNSILTFDVAGTATFQSSNNWLTLTNGMFRLARASTITLTNTAVAYTLLGSTGLSVSNASAVINIGNVDSDAADLLLGGKLEILNGTINIGNTNNFNQDIEYASSGLPEIVIENGSLNVNGQIRRFVASSVGSLVWRQTGGTVTIRGRNQIVNNAKFEIANIGSVFDMSGGSILILRGGAVTFSDVYIRPFSSTVTGGTISFAPGSAIGNQAYTIDSSVPLWNVDATAFNASNTSTLTIQVNDLTIGNNLTIAANSTLNTGDYNLSVGGTFLKNASGIFSRGTQTTTFIGNASVLNGTFTTESFHNLTVADGKILTLAASTPVVVANNLVLGPAATLNDGGNKIEVRVGITNNGTHSSASNSSAFGIELNGPASQSIGGKGTYGNIIINNSNNVSLTDSITVNRRLTLTLGLFDLGQHRLTLGTAAEVTGSFSSARMLRTNGVLSDGGVRKNYSGTGSFTFPIGVFGKYTPATLNVTATSSPGSITVKPINAKHPSTRDAADKQLNYYWNVTRTGFSSFTATHTYTYLQGDVTGNESLYRVGRYVFPNWSPIGGITGALNTTTNVITLTAVDYINGDYTVGEEVEFAGVATYYSRNATAGVGLSDWTTPATWSTGGHGGPAAPDYPIGVPVVIAPDHQVRADIDFLLAESVELNAGAILELEDRYGHNFGVVTGTGKIRIKATGSNQFIFPGGNYEVINGPGGGITEFYDNIDGVLPTQTFYNHVRLIGTSERIQSNVDVTVYGTWSLENGVVTNADFNRTLTLFDDWLNTASASAYVPGDGKVVLAKSSGTQVVGGTQTTDFATLQLNGSADKVLQRSIFVNQALQLTSGNLILGSETLNMGPAATFTGTPADTSMIVTNGTGVVRKRFNVVGSITVPIGDTTATNEYSPITVNLVSGTLGGSASVDVKVTDDVPPACAGSSYTSRYWNAVVNDITAYNLQLSPRYRDADVVGTEADMFAISRIGSGDCVVGAAVNTTTNTATATVSGSPILVTFSNSGFVAEPTVQVSALTIVAVGTTTLQLSWTNGNGSNRLVLVKQGSAVDANPVDGVVYTADADFSGSPQQIGTGNFVVYAGTGTGVTITGLSMNTVYHVRVYEFNQIGPNTNYLLTGAPTLSQKTKVTVSRTVTGDRGWRMVSSAARTDFADLMNGFYSQGFTGTTYPAKQPNLLWYDESWPGTDNQRWRTAANVTDSVVAGRGYMFYVFGQIPAESDYDNASFALPKAITVTGFETPLSSGTFTFPVTYTTAADSGWNLVGNPLADDIDWDHASWTKTNLDNVVYVWSDSANAGIGDYLTWNGTTGSLGNGRISAMQAFWVKANADSPALVLNEAARTTGATFFKQKSPEEQAALDSIPVLEFTLTAGGVSKQLHVMFSETGRAGMDRHDAWHLVSVNPTFLEFYTTSAEGNPLAISNLPRRMYRTADIPLYVGGFLDGKVVTGPFDIRLTGARNLPEMWELELYDRKTKRSVMLTPPGSGRAKSTDRPIPGYSFETAADTTYTLPERHWIGQEGLVKATATSEHRFALKVHPNGEFSDIPAEVTLAQNYPNPFNPSTTIVYTVPEEMPVRLEVFDILGRRLSTLVDAPMNPGRYQVSFDMTRYASGVYLYRLTTPDGSLVRKMTLIK